eukprot:13457653-Alexandrium_andersonii.AAC.1
MSASLVGSEMCIRDRGSTAHAGALGALQARVKELLAPLVRGGLPLPRTCLLYTSDAADDM